MSTPAPTHHLPADDEDPATPSPSRPPAREDGPLDSIGKAITAPIRDEPGSDVDEKPEGSSTTPAPTPTRP